MLHGLPPRPELRTLRLFKRTGWIAAGLRRAVLAAGGGVRVAGDDAWTPCVGDAHSFMRFLLYAEAGGGLPPPPSPSLTPTRREGKPAALSAPACSPSSTSLQP